MATNSPAIKRKPLRSHQAVKSTSAYRVIEVSCFDLARLLDWCASSTMVTQSGSAIGIRDTVWYREAYDSVDNDFAQFLGTKGWAR